MPNGVWDPTPQGDGRLGAGFPSEVQVADRLLDVFADGLGLRADDLSDDTNPDNTPQWDSLAAMQLVSLLEDSFDVRLKTADIMKMRSIGIARPFFATRASPTSDQDLHQPSPLSVLTERSSNARTIWRDHVASVGPTRCCRSRCRHCGELHGPATRAVPRCRLLQRGVARPRIRFRRLQPDPPGLSRPGAVFGFLPHRLVVLWRLEDVFERDLLAALEPRRSGAESGSSRASQELVELVWAVLGGSGRRSCVGIPPTATGFGLDPLDPASSIRPDVSTTVRPNRRRRRRRRRRRSAGRSPPARRGGGCREAHDTRGTLLYRPALQHAMVRNARVRSRFGRLRRSTTSLPRSSSSIVTTRSGAGRRRGGSGGRRDRRGVPGQCVRRFPDRTQATGDTGRSS